MPNCAVSTCSNHHRKTKGSKIVYYGFPRNPHLLERWIQFCCRKDDIKVQFGRICSIHFRPDAFQRNLKAELMGLDEKLKLKPDAVPTENKPDRYRIKSIRKDVKALVNSMNITEVWVREDINPLIFLKEEPLHVFTEEDVEEPVEEDIENPVDENSIKEEIDEEPLKEEEIDIKPVDLLYNLKVETDYS